MTTTDSDFDLPRLSLSSLLCLLSQPFPLLSMASAFQMKVKYVIYIILMTVTVTDIMHLQHFFLFNYFLPFLCVSFLSVFKKEKVEKDGKSID